MKTTYVFGAGASFHAGYPLASTMGAQLLDFMLNYKLDDDFRVSAQNLIEIFGETPNIEHLVSEVEASIESLEGAQEYEDMKRRIMLVYAHTHIKQMLREWFRSLHINEAPLYAEFAARVANPGDTVITFNYDESLDLELRRAGKWDLSTGYGFPFGIKAVSSAVTLLKLHGSINWMASLGGGVTSGPVALSSGFMGGRPVIHTVDAEFLGYKDFIGHTFPGGAAIMSMILPGRIKQFFYDTSGGVEFKGFWDWLWSKAAEALRNSERVVICGYSMPDADTRARELLLGKARKSRKVTIISGNDNEHIAKDFLAAGFRDVQPFNDGLFKEWLLSLNLNVQKAANPS